MAREKKRTTQETEDIEPELDWERQIYIFITGILEDIESLKETPEWKRIETSQRKKGREEIKEIFKKYSGK